MDILALLGAAHGILVLLTAGVVVYSDHQGFLYFRGKKDTLSPVFITWSHRVVWVGLIFIIVSGAALALPAWEYRLGQSVFYLKLGFVLTLCLNAIAIGKLSSKSTVVAFRNLGSDEQKTLLISGALSITGWIGAAVIGLFFL